MKIFEFSTLPTLKCSPKHSLGSTDPVIGPFSVVPASGSTITLHGPKVRGPFTRQHGREEITSIHKKGYQQMETIYNNFQFFEIV